jgi:hypothetical protein
MNAAAQERHEFYGSGIVEPFVIFNGTNIVIEESPSDYVSSYIQAVEIGRTDPTFFDIEIDSITADSMNGGFFLRIITTFTVPNRDITAYIAVLEDSLHGAFTTFYSVCDTLYNFPLEIAYPDTFDTTIVFEHSIEPDKLSAVFFIQDMDSLNVYAATRVQFAADTVSCMVKNRLSAK